MSDWNVVDGGKTPKSLADNIEAFLKKGSKKTIIVVIAALILLWGASGIYSVGPGEEGVVRQFGAVIGRTESGLRYRLPWPIQQVDIVDVQSVRRIEIGYRDGRWVPAEALMLTGDENIVKLDLVIQYRVADSEKFLFAVRDPEITLASTAEVVLRSVIGQNTIDLAMTERGLIHVDVLQNLQELLDFYGTGIFVTEARLRTVDPPDQVRNAFHEVVRALEDRERLVEEARGYMEDLLPRARGEAEAMIRAAEGYKERRILTAEGDVAMFIHILEEYEKSPDITRERLYLEKMIDILPNTTRYLIDSEVGGGVLPFLPLTDSQL